MLRVGVDFFTAFPLHPASLVRKDPAHRDLTLMNQVGVSVILNDPKLMNTFLACRDVTIAQVQTQ
jgi:hypothetical protein